jgi:hypothetical protein
MQDTTFGHLAHLVLILGVPSAPWVAPPPVERCQLRAHDQDGELRLVAHRDASTHRAEIASLALPLHAPCVVEVGSESVCRELSIDAASSSDSQADDVERLFDCQSGLSDAV